MKWDYEMISSSSEQNNNKNKMHVAWTKCTKCPTCTAHSFLNWWHDLTRMCDTCIKQEGFLRCQTPTSTVRMKVEGCGVNNGGCKIKSEEWRVGDQGGCIINLFMSASISLW